MTHSKWPGQQTQEATPGREIVQLLAAIARSEQQPTAVGHGQHAAPAVRQPAVQLVLRRGRIENMHFAFFRVEIPPKHTLAHNTCAQESTNPP